MVFPLIAAAVGGFAASKATEAVGNLAGDAFKAVLGQNGNKDKNAAPVDQFQQKITDAQSRLNSGGKGSTDLAQSLDRLGDAVKEYSKVKSGDGLDFNKTDSWIEMQNEMLDQAKKLVANGKKSSPEAKALYELSQAVLATQLTSLKVT